MCRLPEDCKKWVDAAAKETVATPSYEKIINAIHQFQQEYEIRRSALELA